MGNERLKIEYVSIDKLIPDESNPRKLKKGGLQKLVKSIETYGWTNPIIVQKNTSKILAGHQRLKAAIESGIKKIPVIYIDMEDKLAKAYLIADNKIQDEVAEWDKKVLALMLDDLSDSITDLTITGFDEREIQSFVDKYANKAILDLVGEEWGIEEIYPPFWIVIRGRENQYKDIKNLIDNYLKDFDTKIISSEDKIEGINDSRN